MLWRGCFEFGPTSSSSKKARGCAENKAWKKRMSSRWSIEKWYPQALGTPGPCMETSGSAFAAQWLLAQRLECRSAVFVKSALDHELASSRSWIQIAATTCVWPMSRACRLSYAFAAAGSWRGMCEGWHSSARATPRGEARRACAGSLAASILSLVRSRWCRRSGGGQSSSSRSRRARTSRSRSELRWACARAG